MNKTIILINRKVVNENAEQNKTETQFPWEINAKKKGEKVKTKLVMPLFFRTFDIVFNIVCHFFNWSSIVNGVYNSHARVAKTRMLDLLVDKLVSL